MHLDAQGGQRYEGALGAQLTVSINVCQKNEELRVCGMLVEPARDAHGAGREQGGESSQSLFFSSVEESLKKGGHMWLLITQSSRKNQASGGNKNRPKYNYQIALIGRLAGGVQHWGNRRSTTRIENLGSDGLPLDLYYSYWIR